MLESLCNKVAGLQATYFETHLQMATAKMVLDINYHIFQVFMTKKWTTP